MIVDEVRAEYDRIVSRKGAICKADERRLAATFYRTIASLPKHKIFRQCELLLDAGYTTIPFDWMRRIHRHFEPTDFRRLEYWLRTYVDGRETCDDLCLHALGVFLHRFPIAIPRTDTWTQSPNRWLRRASAMALIYTVRRRQGLTQVLRRAQQLLPDRDAWVRKGCSWMLKTAAHHFTEEVFDFVIAHRQEMPRVVLRGAVANMPAEWKREAMKRPAPTRRKKEKMQSQRP
jgi:3-methyladenine DNA glycosylase AlkD